MTVRPHATTATRFAAALTLAGATLGALGGCGEDTPDRLPLSGEAARGEQVAAVEGCANCHVETGEARLGPSWEGVWNTTVELADGTTTTFDETYVETSVRDPDAQRRQGNWPPMPAYPVDALSDADLDAVIAYLREVGRP